MADMEYFLEQVVMMMPVLGFGFLQPSPRIEPAPVVTQESPLFRLTAAGVRAEARVINGQFVVLKGALARKQGVESWTSYRGQREELLQSGRLVEGSDPQFLVFADNVPFDSPLDPDVDGDQIANGADSDVDGDGVSNGNDSDVDGDGLSNGQDDHVDGDGIANGGDADVDGDGLPNANDPDVDGDGQTNGADDDVGGDGTLNGADEDIDGDGVVNGQDDDMDGDGLNND